MKNILTSVIANWKLTLFIIFVSVFLLMHFASYGNIPEAKSATVSEQLKKEADANLSLALRMDCLRVSARIGACYENNAQCSKFWEAETWFVQEWNVEHYVICTSQAQSALNMGEEIVDEY